MANHWLKFIWRECYNVVMYQRRGPRKEQVFGGGGAGRDHKRTHTVDFGPDTDWARPRHASNSRRSDGGSGHRRSTSRPRQQHTSRAEEVFWDSDQRLTSGGGGCSRSSASWQQSSSDEYGRRSRRGDSSRSSRFLHSPDEAMDFADEVVPSDRSRRHSRERRQQRSSSRSRQQHHSNRVRFSDSAMAPRQQQQHQPQPSQKTASSILNSPRPRLVKSDMPRRLLDLVVQITSDCLTSYSEDIDISRRIKLGLESRLKGCWMVVVGVNYATYLTEDSFKSGTFAYFFIGRQAILVFKSY